MNQNIYRNDSKLVSTLNAGPFFLRLSYSNTTLFHLHGLLCATYTHILLYIKVFGCNELPLPSQKSSFQDITLENMHSSISGDSKSKLLLKYISIF